MADPHASNDRASTDPSAADGLPDVLPASLAGREPLIAAITTFLAHQDADTLRGIRASLVREMEQAGPTAMASLCARLTGACGDWQYYPRDPLARRIHEVLADHLLGAQDATLIGIEHVATVANRPVVIVANHLSYSDANLLEVLLQRAGGGSLADRLAVIAGPKVYSSLKRRFSSLCFGTIKVPQSSAVSSEDAVMTTRDVARAARRSIDIALERLQMGEALLIFAEGRRSRSIELQPMLTGVARYLEVPGTWVLPIGIVGSEALFPIGEEEFRPVRVVARVGPPMEASVLRERAGGNRRVMMDTVGLAVAGLLPPAYRGAYGDDIAGLDSARGLLRTLSV